MVVLVETSNRKEYGYGWSNVLQLVQEECGAGEAVQLACLYFSVRLFVSAVLLDAEGKMPDL